MYMSHLAPPTANSMRFASIAFNASEDEATKAADVVSKLASLSYDQMKKVDTVTVNVGILFDGSIKRAVEIWNADGGNQFKHFLITGYHGEKLSSKCLAQDVVCEHFGILRSEAVHSQVHAPHTGAQADWVAKKMKDLGSQGAILVAPSFHITRKWLTVMESLRKEHQQHVEGNEVLQFAPLPFIPVPLGEDMNAKLLLDVAAEKEGGEKEDLDAYRTITPAEAVHGEHLRILAYQKKGDCLSTHNAASFLEDVLDAYAHGHL